MSEKKKILMADDEKNILTFSGDILRQEGYEVIIAQDGISAFEKALKEKPDLIILDRNMPGMTGDEVCQKIRATNDLKNIPIIFLSGQDSKSQIIQGYSEGANEYLTKPFNVNELVETVKNIFAKFSP